MSRSRIVAVTCMSMLVASGCGSSAKTLSRGQLVAQADAICKRVNDQRAAATKTTADKLGEAIRRIGSMEQKAVIELGKLKAPSKLKGTWQAIVQSDQTLAQYTVNYGEYVTARNIRAARLQLRTAGEVERKARAIAQELGLKDCAEFA